MDTDRVLLNTDYKISGLSHYRSQFHEAQQAYSDLVVDLNRQVFGSPPGQRDLTLLAVRRFTLRYTVEKRRRKARRRQWARRLGEWLIAWVDEVDW